MSRKCIHLWLLKLKASLQGPKNLQASPNLAQKPTPEKGYHSQEAGRNDQGGSALLCKHLPTSTQEDALVQGAFIDLEAEGVQGCTAASEQANLLSDGAEGKMHTRMKGQGEAIGAKTYLNGNRSVSKLDHLAAVVLGEVPGVESPPLEGRGSATDCTDNNVYVRPLSRELPPACHTQTPNHKRARETHDRGPHNTPAQATCVRGLATSLVAPVGSNVEASSESSPQPSKLGKPNTTGKPDFKVKTQPFSVNSRPGQPCSCILQGCTDQAGVKPLALGRSSSGLSTGAHKRSQGGCCMGSFTLNRPLHALQHGSNVRACQQLGPEMLFPACLGACHCCTAPCPNATG